MTAPNGKGIKKTAIFTWDDTNKEWKAVSGDLATQDGLDVIQGLVNVEYDTVELNYTDATKENLSTVVYKKSGATVQTITVTYPTTVKEIYTNL